MSLAFYPTRRLVLLSAAVAPAALLIGLARPENWIAGLALLVLILASAVADAWMAASARGILPRVDAPGAVGVGEEFAILIGMSWPHGAPPAAEIAIGIDRPAGADERAGLVARDGWRAPLAFRSDMSIGETRIRLRAERRGGLQIASLWTRWTGPLGLVWKQKIFRPEQDIAIIPDIRPVREKSAELVHRNAAHGERVRLELGEGAEFESLAQYRPGMDRRAIDWKQSARHRGLIAKEYRTERNQQVVLAIDSGRAMSDPLLARPDAADEDRTALSRVDRAVSAALLAAFVALRDGDRVGLFAFDSRVRASIPPSSGPRAFPRLQRLAAGIDYSRSETNYTLAMATLASRLARRSLIIVFTEFVDSVSAERMIEAAGSLLKRHFLLFVVMKDEELEGLAEADPREAEDVSRAVVAANLLRERALVIARLRHLGVEVIEAAADAAGPALVSAYLELKRRDRL